MRIAVAGTFSVIHEGHRRLFDRAFQIGGFVFVGLTSDSFVKGKLAAPFDTRHRNLREFLREYGDNWAIEEISDIYGPRDIMDQMDAIVVSEETYHNAVKINEDRRSRGIHPLSIEVIDMVFTSEGRKVSSRDILTEGFSKVGGSIVKVSVGSTNPVKIDAVRSIMEREFNEVVIIPRDVESGVPPQPFEGQTREGAINRAKNAIGDSDLSIGIEAGVFETQDGLYDFQYCAILDRDGKTSIGIGSGFRYPDEIASLVRDGMTVGDAIDKVFGVHDVGNGIGAIGLLSNGLITRRQLTEQSIIAAMIPRIKVRGLE